MKNFKTDIQALFIFILSLSFLPAFSQSSEWVSVIGTGDIMLGSNYPSEAKLPVNDGKELLQHVKGILRDADVTFGNLEGCILDKGGNVKSCKSGCYFFRMPDRYVNYLLDAGFDVMNIANNHNGDFGAPGRENTVRVLKNAGLNYAGLKDICETSRFEKNGVKYGFCGFAPNTGTVKITDLPYAKKLVAELKRDCDIVIVSFHGGAEGKAHNRVPKATETFYGENRGNVYEFAHAVIDAGADIVFGHGPHVVRAAELYKDRFIIYSMGNFCTSGDFSISGISGYAPIVKVYTDKTGKFVKGQIFSALQKDKTGPVPDDNHSAAKEIKRLTQLDFPNTPLTISNEGIIERLENTLSFSSCSADSINVADSIGNIAQNIIDYSLQFLNKPYRRGQKGPNAFDCSGFTSFIFKNFGYQLSQGCIIQVKQGTQIDKKELTTGDLIFFKGRNAKVNRVGHVGIVISNHDGNITFIHACRRGVSIDELSHSYYQLRYVTGLRVLS
ncbi:MAG: CapA family protein [Dysgonamonadaceae bacterium]|jgi:cell wall-associated NlpC family hydrolase|nr:CapA family protein [Dysgonamonadaceae bacterium]